MIQLPFNARFNSITYSLQSIKIPDSDGDDIQLAVDAASAAFQSWADTPAQVRSNYLNKIAQLLKDRLEEFAVAESEDQGKPVSLARVVSISSIK